jgi:hypothetical protein
MVRPRKKKEDKKDDAAAGGNGQVPVNAELLAYVKECESAVEDARLAFDEAKARRGLATAEHRLWIAKRNRIIAKTENPADVEDAQREVDNAHNRKSKATTTATRAKDEWKGAEEKLAKAFTERLPLFDPAKAT